MELRGRTALVTGAGRRVGRAIALALGARGMRVAVHYHASRGGAAETVKALRDAGTDADLFAADLGDAATIAPLVAAVRERFGGLDALVNSAAGMERTPFGTVGALQWDAIFALNLRAPFLLAQAAAPDLDAAGGAIVNIADLAAFETWPEYAPHAISKAGIVHMTRILARVMAPRVRVNAVAPGAVLLPEDWGAEARERIERTTPLGRIGSPGDAAAAVVFLLEADYVTGETLIVDGGRHVRR